jgi:hypothetical protein
MTTLLIIWAAITAVLVLLLIYRNTVSMRESDQLFLNDSESHMQKEQALVLQRLQRLQWPVRVLWAASGLLILVILGFWLWRGLSRL